MTLAWTQRQAALLRDCIVSPDVFMHMVERLSDFVVPYQHALETEAGQRNVHLYLQGLLSHLPGKNAEGIATFVDVERQVMQAFIGTALWDHRPLITVLVAQAADRLGEPDGIIAFDPSSFPKRGTHSVGVKRQWCGHRGKVDNCQVGVFMGYVAEHDHALCWTSGCLCPRSGHGTSDDAKHAMCRQRYNIRHDRNSVWRCWSSGVRRSRTAG
jgi:hypothetical protein